MYDERFARQYRYEPPSEFPLTSPFSGIVHHLSGPNRYAHTQTSLNRLVGCWCKYPSSHLHCACRFENLCTRTYVRLLGPCFKTGRIEPFSQRCVREAPMLCETNLDRLKTQTRALQPDTSDTVCTRVRPQTFTQSKTCYHVHSVFLVYIRMLAIRARSTPHIQVKACYSACAASSEPSP